MSIVNVIRVLVGSVDALIMAYAFVRAFSFSGSNRLMRLTLATFALVLTYGQFSLATEAPQVTTRTYVSWVGTALALGLFIAALIADRRRFRR